MQEKWTLIRKGADYAGIGRRFGIDPVIARIMRNRGVEGDEAIRKYLHGGLEDLYDPALMKDLARGAELLGEEIRRGSRIRIIGDYDIDGICSSYILQTGFARLGADADVRLPDRVRDGYGLNENMVREAAEDKREVLVTCDNGIAAAGPVSLANALGLRTVVTDHHEIPFQKTENGETVWLLPPAEAVIDPKQEDCPYPYKGLCGAGVAFKLIAQMYRNAGVPEEDLEELLPFAAIATIGDVMELTDENRIIVREGLARIRRTSNAGLLELILQNGIQPEAVDSYHVGFVIGPCLNASGRIDTAMRALELFRAGERKDAARIAGELIDLNASRKAMTQQAAEEAVRLVEATELSGDRVLVVFLPECHESIAGIVAGRLRERFSRPSFVLTRSEEGVKGSGRSVEAYDMFRELNSCGGYLEKFGGHRMAAGLSMKEENIGPLRRALNENCTLKEEDLLPTVRIDVDMPIGYVTRELTDQLQLLRPFGNGNEKPLFAQLHLSASDVRIFGKNRNVAKCVLRDASGASIDAVCFSDAEDFAERAREGEIGVTYYPEINSFRGRETLQAVITHYR